MYCEGAGPPFCALAHAALSNRLTLPPPLPRAPPRTPHTGAAPLFGRPRGRAERAPRVVWRPGGATPPPSRPHPRVFVCPPRRAPRRPRRRPSLYRAPRGRPRGRARRKRRRRPPRAQRARGVLPATRGRARRGKTSPAPPRGGRGGCPPPHCSTLFGAPARAAGAGAQLRRARPRALQPHICASVARYDAARPPAAVAGQRRTARAAPLRRLCGPARLFAYVPPRSPRPAPHLRRGESVACGASTHCCWNAVRHAAGGPSPGPEVRIGTPGSPPPPPPSRPPTARPPPARNRVNPSRLRRRSI